MLAKNMKKLLFFLIVIAITQAFPGEVSDYRALLKGRAGTNYFNDFLDKEVTAERKRLFDHLNQTLSMPELICSYSFETDAGLKERYLYLFKPSVGSFPGNNAETIAVTDRDNNLLFWRVIDVPNTMMVAAQPPSNLKNPILEIVRLQRHASEKRLRIFYYSLKDDLLKEIE